MKLSIVMMFVGNVLFNAAANLLMKVGMKNAQSFDLKTFSGIVKGLLLNYSLLCGVVAYVISMVFYMFAIKDAKLSVAYPISVSCALILVTMLSGVLLKESISTNQIIGGIVILFGIFILTR